MIPHLIHQVYVGGEIPEREKAWMHSVRQNHPDWSYILWNDDLVKSFGGETVELINSLHSPASKSNFIRLMALEKFGGIYLDADMESLRSLDEMLSESGAFAAKQDETRICNAFMGAPAGHPWILWQIRNWWKFDQQDPASGVYLATEAPREGLTLLNPDWVYPWKYDDPPEKRVIQPSIPLPLLAHHWSGSWTK